MGDTCKTTQTPEECPEIVKPTVINDCPECLELIPSNCVTTSEAFPVLNVGKGSTLTNALSKIATKISTLFQSQTIIEELPIRTLRDFGAKANGSTDDTAIIQLALNSGLPIIEGEGLSYFISSRLTIPSGVTLQNLEIVIDETTYPDDEVIYASGSLEVVDTPTVDISKGDSTITVTNGAIYSEGDYVFLKSNAVWNTSESVTYGEILRIKSITTNVLTLETKTLLPYTSANSFTVQKINTVDDIALKNIKCEGNLDNTSSFARFNYCTNIKVDNCRTFNFDYAHYYFVSCVDSSVERSLIDGSGTIDGLNYGVAISWGSVNCRVLNTEMIRNRHGVTSGGNDGISRHVIVKDCVFRDMYSSAIDSHGAVYEHSFIDNEVHITSSNGINIRGVKPTVRGNKIIGATSHGIVWFPLVESTVPVNVCAKITDNEVTYETLTTGDAYGVYCLTPNTATASIDSLEISNNTVNGETFNRGHIWVLATGSDIKSVSINDNKLLGGSRERGIYIYAVSPRNINTLFINDNEVTAGTVEPIYLRGNATGLIDRVMISSNIIKGGSWSLRTDYVDFMKTVGNFYFDGSSGAKLNTNTTNFTDLDT